MSIISRLTSGIKSFFAREAPVNLFLSGSARNWRAEVGDGTSSSTVMAPLLWILRTFPEAPLGVWRINQTNPASEKREYAHPMARLIRRPNKFYTGVSLWTATISDYIVNGNAYWIVVQDKGGRVAELWWAPASTMTPHGNETDFITHYEYRPNGGTTFKLANDSVIHFRFGLDPDNARLGRSPLNSVLREVFTDDEAATFTASILRNMGVPGIVISPTGDLEIKPEDAEKAKADIKAKFTGDHRGDPIVMTSATKVEQFGFNPQELLLKDLRRIPEERVSAVLGVPAVVAGLGAGLDRSTFTNFAEARVAAYEQNIIPTQTALAEDLWGQLLPQLETGDTQWIRVGFDHSRVRVLQPDQTEKVKRLDVAVRGGWMERAEARDAIGLPVRDMDHVYLVQSNTVEVPADGSPARNYALRKPSPAETLQKAYLGVDKVVTADEARQIVNDETGANLPVPGPTFGAK
jgi:HK97 family phage portal protein